MLCWRPQPNPISHHNTLAAMISRTAYVHSLKPEHATKTSKATKAIKAVSLVRKE